MKKFNFLVNSQIYSEYPIKFHLDKQLKNIKQINLISYKFPNFINNINNNLVNFKIDNKQHDIELTKGFYTIKSLIEYLNQCCEINFELINGHINIHHEKDFELINNQKSVLHFLGFEKNNYSNKNNYQNDSNINLSDNSYLKIKLNNIHENNTFDINIKNNIDYNKSFNNLDNIESLDIEVTDEFDNLLKIPFKLEFQIICFNDNINFDHSEEVHSDNFDDNDTLLSQLNNQINSL